MNAGSCGGRRFWVVLELHTVKEGRDMPGNLGTRSQARFSERAANSGKCSDLVGKAVMVVVTAGLAVAPAGGQAATAIVC